MTIDLTKPAFHFVRAESNVLLIIPGKTECPAIRLAEGPEETLGERIAAAKDTLRRLYPQAAADADEVVR